MTLSPPSANLSPNIKNSLERGLSKARVTPMSTKPYAEGDPSTDGPRPGSAFTLRNAG